MGRLGGIFCSPECKFTYYGELDTPPYSGGKRRKRTRKKRKSNNNTMKRYKRRKTSKHKTYRRRSKRRRGGSKKLTTKQKNNIIKTIKGKLHLLGLNTNLNKLRKKLGGPKKFKSYTQKRKFKKRRNKTKKR
jgi:hypothetical protein